MKLIPLNRVARLFTVSFALCVSAHAATFTVTNTADSGAGSLRQAVTDTAAAAGADTIGFAAALSGQTITLGSEITIGSVVTIDASALAGGITIDGGAGTNRIFYVNGATTVSLIGLTLTGGNGGGAFDSGSGGAIVNRGTLALTRCTVSGNTANQYGGAIFNILGTLSLNSCTFSGNFCAVFGGALYCYGGTVTVDACTFVGNTATYVAGAVLGDSGILSVTRSTFFGNTTSDSASTGGAVGATGENGTAIALENCTIVGNHSAGTGGLGGGGVWRRGPAGIVLLKNCIVAGNTSGTVGTENLLGTINQTGTNITSGDPLVAPLGNYGGPTQTMLPLPGSPAIDTAMESSFTTDQRGCPILGVADVGAVEAATLVTTGTDELDTPASSGISLREAVRDTPAGGAIVFALTLSGGTCTLTNALGGEIVLGKDVTIDASALAGGITIDGGTGTNRIFSVAGAATNVTLRNLTLTGGGGEGASKNGGGGAILTEGLLNLEGCTLHGNTASLSGGAIHKPGGTLALSRCTLSGNSSASGGALSNSGPLSLTHCTLSGNTATNVGGGILHQSDTLTLTHSIVAGNTGATGGDIRNNATVVRAGANVIQSYSGVAASGPPAINAAPLLGPLGRYGGATPTRPPFAGSPALNAAVGSPATADQRGFPIVGTPDIGAYEAGTLSSFNVWAVETTGLGLDFGADGELDGAINGLEYALRRDPLVSDVPLSPTLGADAGGGHVFAFRYRAAARDIRYIVQRSTDLTLPAGGWTEIYRLDTSNGLITEIRGVSSTEDAGTEIITLVDFTVGPTLFWRLRVERAP